MNNYKLPLDPSELISETGTFQKCSQAESIAQNIMLLITTRRGENRYNPDYGNRVWDLEFENRVTTVEWEKIFIDSLKDQISKYELRIVAPKIEIHIEYVEQTYGTKKFSEMKKRAKIAVNAKFSDTGELFSFSTILFLSPMSVD